ncbi:MAG: hypothetical protein H6658_21520, partial [Ardenticatenaceae bacterium]|nr:hypothetical protein [Ardenticatenaceae bacterium]
DTFFWEVGDLDAMNGIVNAVFSTSAPGATWNATTGDFAIRVEGYETGVCVDLADIPWASVSPAAGSTVSNTSSMVNVAFDSTGMATGTYTGTLCVNSNDPDTPIVQVPLTLTVVPTVYGVEIAPDAAMTGTNGTSVMYSLYVTNTGNAADTFDLSATGVWTATLSDSSVSLGAGESAMIMVTVDIPADAGDGDMDMATVTATSQGDAAATDSAMLTTTAVVEIIEPPVYMLYLPFVTKN